MGSRRTSRRGRHTGLRPSELRFSREAEEQLEVRETKDHLRVFVGPREVAVHDKVVSTLKQRKTLPAHRPPRGQQAAHVTPLPRIPTSTARR